MLLQFTGFMGALIVCSGSVLAGPITDYWLTAGDQSVVYVVNGSGIVNTINTPGVPNHEYPIAIGDTVRTYGGINGWFGREYQLDGTLTGNTYTNPGDFTSGWDGTTDGSTFNYSLGQATGQIVQYDRNWANGSVLFTASFAGDFQWGGITYDSSNGTLWVNRRGGDPEFRNYALDGTLLSSFTLAGDAANWGLAYEEVSDSLWVLGSGGGEILNLSKTGTVLEALVIPGLAGNILGGEMRIRGEAVVPEPSSLALFILGMASLPIGAVWRRRRKNVA